MMRHVLNVFMCALLLLYVSLIDKVMLIKYSVCQSVAREFELRTPLTTKGSPGSVCVYFHHCHR